MKLPINIKFSDTAQQMTQVVLPERWLRYDYVTLALFAAGTVGYCALLASVMFDLAHPAINIIVSTCLVYVAFTVVHESVHNNLFAGDNKRQWLNDSIGWVASVPFILIPSSVFKTLHLQHHAFLNHPDKDPDYFARANHPTTAIAKCAVMNVRYLIQYLQQITREEVSITSIMSSAVYFCLWSFAIGTAYRMAWLPDLVLYAVLPAFIASIVLGYVFDHIVHHPHHDQDPHTGTNHYDFIGAKWLTLGQNSHVVHHVDPRLQWHQYDRHLPEVLEEKYRKKSNILGANVALPEQIFDQKTSHSNVNRTPTKSETITATYQGQAFSVGANETILQAAINQKIRLPHLCQKGICGQCKMKVKGEVIMQGNNILTKTEQAHGYVLVCQSFAKSDVKLD